ncbi:death-on-curing family protein (plasmid) [Gemmatirosa kalamazoonensis]|uniref:Death-on-curing family protein n=1 Tax=Gemmatirosa kalamazoonensis TaxID=861299 RepID=W0RRB3_9BACT|nr:type II toxin-antitoxin system death-on-curing family toxin [Gemmatirosa kalamazoonensis]AHG92855.1 death-on-curing family protein [Gemmatirosa kalamazoonensis]
MRYLSLAEVIELHRLVVEQAGGAAGLRDLGALESAVAQPRATFDGADLYATLAAKAAALGYSLALNHAFVDGNKRVAHAALETFLMLNGYELAASVDEAEATMLALAAGELSREGLAEWVAQHVTPLPA